MAYFSYALCYKNIYKKLLNILSNCHVSARAANIQIVSRILHIVMLIEVTRLFKAIKIFLRSPPGSAAAARRDRGNDIH